MISAYRARQIRRLIERAVTSLTDEDALECPTLFEAWTAGAAIEIGARREYGGKLYRCEQSHTTVQEWTPDKTPALWTAIAMPGEIPVWRQPSGAQDAYRAGDRVHYPDESGPVYVSTADNNVWQPGVYGWEVTA